MDTLDYAKLGIEAESFLRSSLGKYMMSRADEIIKRETQNLVNCDAYDTDANRDIRNEIRLATMFKYFIDAVIEDGKTASEQLDN